MAYASEEKHTKAVLERWEDIPDPRLREVMQSAIKHLHSFVSEVRPTGAEWFEAIKFLTAIGQKCDNKRQEFILLSDIMGVSMLVDDINNRRVAGATPSTVEGPFHIPDAPEFGHGGSMADGAPGIPCFVTGDGARPRRSADRGRGARPVADGRRRPLRGAAPHGRALDARHLQDAG